MESIFEPETYLFDPSHDDSNSFLTFSSFSDLTTSWYDFPKEYKEPPANSVSDASSPTPSDPFEVIHAAFEPATPAESEFGIFHTPTKQRSSHAEDQSIMLTHKSSGSGDSWGEPMTPSLTGKSFAELSGRNNNFPTTTPPSAFSWDEATPSIAGSSYTPPTPSSQPYRVASNPVLGSSRQPRTIKPITSMPALREEDSLAASQMFDTSEFLQSQPLQIPSLQFDGSVDHNGEGSGEDFSWSYGDAYGFGTSLPTDGTIFEAFQTEPTSAIAMGHSHSHTGVFPQPSEWSYAQFSDPSDLSAWIPGLPAAQDVVGLGQFDFSNQELTTAYTVDPTAIMGTYHNDDDEEMSRPSSAPDLNGGESSSGLLSVPTADVMTRSLSSEGLVPSRNAPPRDLFSYAPQQIPSGPPGPQPLYTSDPSPSYKALAPSPFPRGMPLTPTPSSKRSASANLSIQIHPPALSTFSPFPPTPQSATFAQSLAAAQSQPITMQRAETNPLPQRRRLSGVALPAPPMSGGAGLARAQAMQQQEEREQRLRVASRRESASRRFNITEPSVMQQPQAAPRPPVIMGWEGPSAQTGAMPVLTHTPLVTVHPPPASYSVAGAPVPAHRVHPPPHPGTANRPIARLPSTPVRARKVSTTASPARTTPGKGRSPSGKKRATPVGGAFSWGETQFINFTSDDAEKLLTGVAPSGSQSKRKREEEAAAAAAATVGVANVSLDDDEARSKRSKSDE